MFLVRSTPLPARNIDHWPDGIPTGQRGPALDVAETDGSYAVNLDLPGVDKSDVKVEIDGRTVSVSASTARDAAAPKGQRLLHRERSSVACTRRFTLPEEIDQEASLATLDKGVLSLTLAKKRTAAAKHIVVN